MEEEEEEEEEGQSVKELRVKELDLRVKELQRSAWALKNKVIQEYTREKLAQIQLMGDTWVKACMTLGQLDPLPGGPVPSGGIRLRPKEAKKKARRSEAEAEG